MSPVKRVAYFYLFFIIFILFIIILNIYLSNKMFNKEINFVVASTKITPAKRLHLYNKDGESLGTHGYGFYSHDDVREGDSIVKAKKSKVMFVYRKNEIGDYYVNLGVIPNDFLVDMFSF